MCPFSRRPRVLWCWRANFSGCDAEFVRTAASLRALIHLDRKRAASFPLPCLSSSSSACFAPRVRAPALRGDFMSVSCPSFRQEEMTRRRLGTVHGPEPLFCFPSSSCFQRLQLIIFWTLSVREKFTTFQTFPFVNQKKKENCGQN